MKNKIPKTAITERQLKKLIKSAATKYTSLSDWAVAHGVTAQQVTAFFRKDQGAGLKIPELLGYRPQTVFLPLDEPLISTMARPRKATKNPSKKVDHSREPIERRGLRTKNDRQQTKNRLKRRRD